MQRKNQQTDTLTKLTVILSMQIISKPLQDKQKFVKIGTTPLVLLNTLACIL